MADTTHISVPVKGMNTDAHEGTLDEQWYDYAMNAETEDIDGQGRLMQNIASTIKAVDFPKGYSVAHVKPIVEQNRILFFLAGLTSMIVEITGTNNPELPGDLHELVDNECTDCSDDKRLKIVLTKLEKATLKLNVIANSDCLNFSILHPIRSAYRVTECGVEVVFTDLLNERRRIEFEYTDPYDRESPLKVSTDYLKIVSYATPDPDCGMDEPSSSLEPVYSDEIDCSKLSFQPKQDRLIVEPIEETAGGSLQAGVYQFFAAGADVKGLALTAYMGSTNPFPIFSRPLTVETDYKSGKAIVLKVNSVPGGPFDYFNIAVAKTVDNFTTFELVGTFPAGTTRVVYTGNDTYIQLNANDIFERAPFYKNAADVTASNDFLFFTGLQEWPKGNWQRVALDIRLKWVTREMPIGSYKNPAVAAGFKSLLRDEGYMYGIIFEFTNGDETPALLLVNRAAEPTDLEEVNDPNSFGTAQPRYKVYNTARVTGTPRTPYDSANILSDAIWEEGDFAYQESEEKYPNDQQQWGELAGKNVRIFKTPDFRVSPFFGVSGRKDMIYPLGVKVDHSSVLDALDAALGCGFISGEDRARVRGYRLVRANRAGWNTVVAKGLVYDSWSYQKKNKTYYYPNYPFNDHREDPFISPTIDTYDRGAGGGSGHNVGTSYRNKFVNTGRYTFHSPETHFNNPSIEGLSEMKIECVSIGEAKGYFKEVEDHAKYKLPSVANYTAALLLSTPPGSSSFNGVSLSGLISGPVTLLTNLLNILETSLVPGDVANVKGDLESINAFLNDYSLWKEVAEALVPFRNFFVQYQGVGTYFGYQLPDQLEQRRPIVNKAYLTPQSVVFTENNNPLYFNNWQRESSVYLKIDSTIKPSSQYTIDNSRYTISEAGMCNSMDRELDRSISAYYVSLKRPLISQYGNIFGIEWLDCGKYKPIGDTSDFTVFSGDTFIGQFAVKRKHPFFLYTGVGFNANSDILYSEIGNVGYPNYYFDTSRGILDKLDFTTAGITDVITRFADVDILRKLFGLPVYRFDCREDKRTYINGKVYAYSYGIANFPVESSINLDLRHGKDNRAGDFYPNNQDLDSWLQQKNVPIKEDNQYHYNTTYSKQNKESVIVPLAVDFEPNEVCKTQNPNDVVYSADWRKFKFDDKHSFSLQNGKLVGIYGIENDKVLALFEKTFILFNAYITLATNADSAIISSGKMFAGKPQQFTQTDLGYGGASHKALLSTEFGHIWINAPQGEIFLLGNNGSSFKNLAEDGMSNWFRQHLPMEISKAFPAINDDNGLYGIGIHLGYDKSKKHLYLTKLDYKVKTGLQYDPAKRYFYVVSPRGDREIVPLGDERYFENVSWTITYKFPDQAWKSFHSILPNYYVSLPGYMQSGLNKDCPDLWSHGLINSSFQVYYGKVHPFEVQVQNKPDLQRNMLKSVAFGLDVVRYHGLSEYYEDEVTFNRALIYNNRQTTGYLDLIKKDPEDHTQSFDYPQPRMAGRAVLISKLKNAWSFNQFGNIALGKKNNIPPMVYNSSGTHLVPNLNGIDPFQSELEKIKGEVNKIRLMNDRRTEFKFRLKWINNNQSVDL